MNRSRGSNFVKAVAALFALQVAQEVIAFSPSASTSRLHKTRQSKASALYFFPKKAENAVSTKQRAAEEENTTSWSFSGPIQSAWNNWLVAPAEEENDYNKVTKENESTSGLLQMVNTYTKPVQEILDESSSGWALSYADLKPDTSMTPAGQAFLATNLAYLLTGLGLQMAGEYTLGTFTDLCAFASFMYHYQQLESTSDEAVRIALLLDYVFAALAMGTASLYLLVSVFFSNMVLDESLLVAMAVTASSLGFLCLSWKFEYGRPYMAWHSLWHLASAYSGFLIGNLHLTM